MRIRSFIAAAGTLALAAGLVGGLSAHAQARTTPLPTCVSSFFQKCATITITGVEISPAPNPVLYVGATVQLSNIGTQVTDFPLLVDGVKVSGGPSFGGGADTLYGTYPAGWQWTSDISISPGRHVLTAEIIGLGGALLATSPRYVITAP
jgi:hypothetical protein